MLNAILGILGISVLIFVHELGHFLAAKWAGARVKTFSLGFDPTIRGIRLKLVSWTWGETEYVIGLIPFGGYVQPADREEAEQEGRDPAPVGEFTSQPPFKRAVIFAAGAAMNIAFGLAAFVLAFSVGVTFQAPHVGSVVPGSPAWEVGIQAGDKLIAVDGSKVESFMDVAIAAVLGGTNGRVLTIERDGIKSDVRVTPRVHPTRGMPDIGLAIPISRTVAAVAPNSSAEKAGIKAGDRVLSAIYKPGPAAVTLGESLPDTLFVSKLAILSSLNAGASFSVSVESAEGSVRELPLTSEPPENGAKVPRMGVHLIRRSVTFVRPGSKAAEFFQPGDLIRSVNGEPVYLMGAIQLAERHGAAQRLELRCASGKTQTLDRETLFAWMLGNDVIFSFPRTVVKEVEEASRAAKAGLQPGDRIVAVASHRVGHEDTIARHIGSSETELTFYRGEERLTARLPAGEDLGISWDHRPAVGRVQSGSPADKGGVQPGDLMVKLGGQELERWDDLVQTVHNNPEKTLDLVVLRGDAPGQEKVLKVTPVEEPYGALGINFEQARITVREPNVMAAISLGAKRTVVSIKQILVTIMRLVQGEVATKNLQGPVGIIHITGLVTRYGFGTLLYFLALISVNLGVLNLLPLPIFDGGHLLLLACEKIKGSPVNEKIVQGATTVMFFLLIALAVYVTYHDVLRIL